MGIKLGICTCIYNTGDMEFQIHYGVLDRYGPLHHIIQFNMIKSHKNSVKKKCAHAICWIYHMLGENGQMSCTISHHNQTALGCNVFIQALGQSVLMSISGPRNSERSPGLSWLPNTYWESNFAGKSPIFYPCLSIFRCDFPFQRPFRSGFPSAPAPRAARTGTSSWEPRQRCDRSWRIDRRYKRPCDSLKQVPSGKRLHSELERSTIFNGKIHYFYGHFQ